LEFEAMDWIMIFYLLTESPNAENVQSHSHTLVNFTSEKLCTDALNTMKTEFKLPEGSKTKITLRGVCIQRKDR
jgi:hypothetical protein